jgi:hypothetical protein
MPAVVHRGGDRHRRRNEVLHLARPHGEWQPKADSCTSLGDQVWAIYGTLKQMMKRVSSDAELIALADWCRTIVRFLADHCPPEDQPMYAQFEESIARGVKGGSLEGMKDLARILTDMWRDLPPHLNRQLDDLLRIQLDRSPAALAANQANEVGRILEQGRIENDHQYSLLERHVDIIFQDRSKQQEIDEINALLATYDQARSKS